MNLRPFSALRSFAAAALLVPALWALQGCGGGDGPPAQTRPTQVQLTGTATDGSTLSTSATVKGTAGVLRTSTAVAGTTAYAVLLDQLTGPYMVQAGAYYAVALGEGNANATPLTSLVTSALFGQDAAAAFTAFGPTNPSLTSRVTAANIASAQAATLAFLRNNVGLTVPTTVGDFTTTLFAPKAGDAMYDLIIALKARADALGPDAYGNLVAGFVNHAHLCIVESIGLTIGGATTAFCPATKTATSEDDDGTIVDQVFTSDTGDVLTVRARDAVVSSASYVPAGAAQTYACADAACSGITLGAPATDLSRTVAFTSATLASGAGNATLTGSLQGAIPGVALPVLPCTDNRFFLIRPDRSVVADCVDISDGAGLLGLPGTFGQGQGTTDTAVYRFLNTQGSNGLPAVDSPTLVYITLAGSTVASIDVVHRTTDQDTGITTVDFDYKCRGSACNGVTVDPPTVNSDFGFPITLRTVTLDNTVLSAVNADGMLSATVSATIKGSFSGLYISNADQGSFAPPAADVCAGFSNQVLTTPADEGFVFPSCAESVGGFYLTTALANGDLQLQMFNYGTGDVTVTVSSTGAVKSVRVDIPTESFGCSIACNGVSVSAPDADGNRTVTLSDTLLNIIEPDDFATGARTAKSTGVFTVPPPEVIPDAVSGRPQARRVRLPGALGLR